MENCSRKRKYVFKKLHNNFWPWTPAIFKLSLNERLWIFHWGCVIIYCDFIMVKVPSPNALNCVIIDSKVDRVKVKKSESISVHSPHSLGQNQGKWVLTTKPLEDVSQGHSNQVLDCICTQSNMTSRQSPWTDGVNSVGDMWYKFIRRPWKTSSNGFVVNVI